MNVRAQLLLALVLATPLTGQEFSPDKLMIDDTNGRVMTYLNRPAVYLLRGSAELPDVDFTDGSIEFDVALSGIAGFAGLRFRTNAAGDGEVIYIRPARSRQPDAVQYAPVFGDLECWQLYNGDGYTAAVELPLNRWTNFRVDVNGDTAMLYVDGATKPALVVSELKSGNAHGTVALWGRLGAAMFSNVRVTRRPPTDRHTKSIAAFPGVVTRWSISPSFDASKMSGDSLPPAGTSWQAVTSGASGLLNITRLRPKVTNVARNPRENGIDLVYAKTVLQADRARNVRLDFGYSDAVTIFLNGRRLFSGRSAFLSRDPTFLGIIGWADTVDLDLRRGANELVFAITDQQGGAGVQARLTDGDGIEIK